MIEWIFSGIGLTVIPIIYFFLTNRKKKNIIRDIENEIHQKDDSQNRLKASIKEFNSYVPVDIYFYNNYLGKHTYTVNKFREELKYNEIYPKLNIIFGDAGSGKSILMTYFCYSYCKYHSLEQRKKFNNLYDRGVIYIRLLHFRDMEQLMSRLRNDFSKYSNINLLVLDGLDEFREINNKKAEDLIISIFDQLETENFLNNLKQVYITSRKEPFIDIYNSFNPDLVYQSNRPRIGEICLLTPKQILKVYTRQGLRKYKRKLKKFISGQEHTIFEIPFFIQYADIILRTTNQQYIVKEDALFIIIEEWIKNEWNKYWTKYSHNYKNQNRQIIYIDYVEMVYKCLNQFSSYLLINNEYELSTEIIRNIATNLGNNHMFDSAFYLLTRNLIHKNNNKYSFVHFSFYDFFVAKALIENLSISYDIKKSILLSKKGLETAYIYHINNIVNSKKMLNYILNEKEKSELIKLKNIDINNLYQQKIVDLTFYDIDNLSVILKIFPKIEEMKFHQYNLNLRQIDLIRNNNELSFYTNKDKISLKFVKNFGNLDVLDLGRMRLEDEDIIHLKYVQLNILEFNINIQEKETILKLSNIYNIKELHIFGTIEPDIIIYIYRLWKKGKKIQFYIEDTQLIADRIYYNIEISKGLKYSVLNILYSLVFEGILVESEDEYAYIDVGNYLVSLLVDNKEINKAKDLAEYLIAKEDDDSIRVCKEFNQQITYKIINKISDFRYPKYAHIDLIFTLGEIYLKNFKYESAYDLFQRGIYAGHKIFGECFDSLRCSYSLIGERSFTHFKFLYGMSACLIGKYDISLQYLSRIAELRCSTFHSYIAFCSWFLLANSFWGLGDFKSANSWLQKCNSDFLLENVNYHQNYNIEILTALIKIINENLSVNKEEVYISYVSKILYGKILALLFQDFDTASKYFVEGIEEMSNLFGAQNNEVIKEKENIKAIFNKELVWKDCE